MSDDTVVISLRLPKSLRDKLRAAAQKEHRSLNGQVVMLLENATTPKMRAERRAG